MLTLQGVQCKLLPVKDCKLRNISSQSDLASQLLVKHKSTAAKPLQSLHVNVSLHITCCCMHCTCVCSVCAYSTSGALYACDILFGCVHMLCVQVLCTHVIRCTVCMLLRFTQEEWQSFAFWLPGYQTLQKHNCQCKVACLTMYALCASRPCLPRPSACWRSCCRTSQDP